MNSWLEEKWQCLTSTTKMMLGIFHQDLENRSIMEVLMAIVLGISCLVVLWAAKSYLTRRNLPPGPTPLPLLGNIFHIKNGQLITFLNEMRSQYGDVFTVYFGLHPVVVVSGYQPLKEALLHCENAFSGRGKTPCLDAVCKNHGVAFTTNLHRWKELRRFSVSILKEFGMGNRNIEDVIQEESQHLVTEIRKTKGSLFDPSSYLARASCNIICFIVFGQRFEYNKKEMESLTRGMHEAFYLMGTIYGQLYSMFPGIMKYLPGDHHKMFQHMEDILSFVRKRVQMNQKTLDLDCPRDYIDAFLIEMEKEKGDPNTEFNMTNLVCSALQIFFAGTETTSTTMTYGFLLLLKHPDVQDKVHEELDRVVGRNRSPNYHDKTLMPYTDAVIHEIIRFSDLAPLSITRALTKDIQFHGYTIPKDTASFLMLTSVLHDPEYFPNPERFNPGNFLDEDGGFKKNNAFVAFAAGKRSCMGESLARMELFIFFTTILQNFTLRSPLPPEDIDIASAGNGIGNFPKPYKLYVEAR